MGHVAEINKQESRRMKMYLYEDKARIEYINESSNI